jgi:hypothetical protein
MEELEHQIETSNGLLVTSKCVGKGGGAGWLPALLFCFQGEDESVLDMVVAVKALLFKAQTTERRETGERERLSPINMWQKGTQGARARQTGKGGGREGGD